MPLSPSERRERSLAQKKAKLRWKNSHLAWIGYGRNLKTAAKMVGQIVKAHAPALIEGDVGWQLALQRMMDALERYGKALDPWASSVARLMLAEVDRREKKAWIEHARRIGREIKREIEVAPTGRAYQEGMARQVDLITSLPRVAAQRVHELATGQLYSGLRGADLLDEILKTGEVTASRATLIARTEVARAGTEFTKARAEYIGSTHFIWRTSKDADVRSSHKKLEGTVHRWDAPPICDPPDHRALPGAIWNCRCFTGETLVSLDAGMKRLWRVPYEGEIIRIATEGGWFEATPLHPIGSEEGWVVPSEIKVGDELSCILERPRNYSGEVGHAMVSFGRLCAALRRHAFTIYSRDIFECHDEMFEGDGCEIVVDKDLLDGLRGLYVCPATAPATKTCKVIEVSRRPFHGYVYTIETDTGYYGVGDQRVMAKNCYAEPVIPDEYMDT